MYFCVIIFFVWLILPVIRNYYNGDEKSKEISLLENTNLYYNVSESLPLTAGSYFYVDELFPRIRGF